MSAKSNKIVKLSESQNANQAIDKSRRSFARLGVAAPVIMTLASKPVFAVQDLSHMQSANLSGCRGNDRFGGWSPGGWMTPNGTHLNDENTISAWNVIGIGYGHKKRGTDGKQWEDYDWTNYSPLPPDLDTGGVVSMFHPTKSLRQVLIDSNGSSTWHYIAAYLNALYLEHHGYKYIFDSSQLAGLMAKNDSFFIAYGYQSLADLIESNYHAGLDVCKQPSGTKSGEN